MPQGVTAGGSSVDTASIRAVMQGTVGVHVNMAVLAVVLMDGANNIGRAVTARTLGYPGRLEPRGMGIT